MSFFSRIRRCFCGKKILVEPDEEHKRTLPRTSSISTVYVEKGGSLRDMRTVYPMGSVVKFEIPVF